MLPIIVLLIIILLLLEIFSSNKISNKKIKELPVRLTVLGDVILTWCENNLGKRKQRPKIVLRYYLSKKLFGKYISEANTIVIYTKSNITLEQFTNTMIHEYVHHLQFKELKNQKRYNKLLQEIGYNKHPMEIEARMVADKNTMKCIDVISKEIRLDKI